ncbi:MAG: alpha/beta hydrolase [Dehalococcoidia bacterium]|uniref:alpha/beta hydrolase n=1 Tax=Candidatus Amarobacter glycogenicus TaxID=3140699 RepID=UPI0031350B75|nr:alpha/beta hydrolase [Dehalococcoidia bacterium]
MSASRASFEVNLAACESTLLPSPSNSSVTAIPRRPNAVRRILQLLEHLGYGRALFCGHSLGGALALRLALEAPEWVAGLIVINSSSAAGDPPRRRARPSMSEMAARVRAEGTGFMKKTRLYPAHSRRLDPLSRELLTRDFDRLAPAGVAGTAESLVVDVNAWERHPTLSVPFLLIVGERDADFAPNADAFLSRFPPDLARVIRLPEAGHAANIEQPRQFEEAVTGFAREIAYLRAPAAQGSMVLTALGGALVFGGLGLLAAALFFTGGTTATAALSPRLPKPPG